MGRVCVCVEGGRGGQSVCVEAGGRGGQSVCVEGGGCLNFSRPFCVQTLIHMSVHYSQRLWGGGG